MRPKVLLVTSLSVVALAIGLAAAVSLVRQRQVIDTPAAVPSGTSTITITPSTPSLFVGQTTTLTASLNTGNQPITGYQVVASYTYTGTTPPLEILGQVNTTVNTALSQCFGQATSIVHDTVARRFTISISCSTPITFPATTYSTNTPTPIFTFDVRANAVGNVTLTFDTISSKVTAADSESTDVLTFPVNISVTSSSDTQAPAAITNLSTNTAGLNSFNLAWTAPTDVGPAGRAATYEIRYGTSTLTEANFAAATLAANPPTPGNAGTNQTYSLTELNPDTMYFVAVKSRDAGGNLSAISNVASLRTLSNPSLTFNVRFQAVNINRGTKNVRVILRQGAIERYRFDNVVVTGNAQGIYSATIPNLAVGTYDILIKGPAHLQNLTAGIQLAQGTNTVNWPATTPILLAGDINTVSGVVGDNFVDISDYSVLAGQFAPGVPKVHISDINFDGVVDITDYSILAGNFRPGVPGAN